MSHQALDEKGNLLPRPPYHAQIASLINTIKPSNNLTLSSLPELRAQTSPTAEAVIGDRPVHHVSTRIHGVEVSIFTSTSSISGTKAKPCICHIHGGGTVAGNRFLAVEEMLDWVVELDLVCVSVEYRLAPEDPFPAGLDDCRTVLGGLQQRGGEEYGVDGEKVVLVAGSGGAVLAAGLALKIRDESTQSSTRNGTSALKGMLLYSPSLSHRLGTVSAKQFVDGGISDRKSSERFWAWYLGGKEQQYDIENVSIYASPGSASNMSGLPPTYIDVGSSELYRDEAVEFASKVWRGGGECELHVWPGGCHIFNVLCPQLEISSEAIAARKIWVQRCLGPGGLV